MERGYTQAKHEFTLANKPRAVQHCVATTSNWETDTGFPNRLINHEIDSWFQFRDFTRCTEIPLTGLMVQNRMYGLSQNDASFWFKGCTVQKMHEGISAKVQPIHAQTVWSNPGGTYAAVDGNGSGTPNTACFDSFNCMHMG